MQRRKFNAFGASGLINEGTVYELFGITESSGIEPSDSPVGYNSCVSFLPAHRGIAPEKAFPDHQTCSVGFCEEEQKWYGWSHPDGSTTAVPGKYRTWHNIQEYGHGEWEAKTLEDARAMACDFAENVS